MQFELRSMQRRFGITTVLVTHDQEEALSMSDQIAVMSSGHILQIGGATEIYDRPASRFVAEFLGTSNIFAGTATAGRTQYRRRKRPGMHLSAPRRGAGDGHVLLSVRPERLVAR